MKKTLAQLIIITSIMYSIVASAAEVYNTTTNTASNITSTSATLSGQFVNPDVNWPLYLFFYLGTATPPTDQHEAAESPIPVRSPGTYSFTYNATGLTCNTTYYYYAYVDDLDGDFGTGSTLSFTTSACDASGPQSIPTLSQWVILLLVGILGFLGLVKLRPS